VPQRSLDDLVAKVAGQIGPLSGEVRPLDGGITNRNLCARFGGGDYVIRLPGKDTDLLGIDREAEHQATLAAARVGIGPEVALYVADAQVLVTRFIEGRTLEAAELSEPDVLADVAESLRTVHKEGPRLRQRFSPFRIVEAYKATAEDRGVTVDERYAQAHALATEVEAALTGPDHAPVLCHDDLLPSNLIHDGDRVRIVDWEYAGMGDRFFDLGNLSINAGFDEGDDEWLLTAYFNEPPTARRFAAVRLMRLMSDFREAMWGVVQGAISELDFDFADYADEHFTRLLKGAEDPQVRRWLQEARESA
jgi:thiamine kinase-like enzyme